MWENNLLFKILVSCTDNGGEKKNLVSKKKVSFPLLKTDQGCSCKQPSYNKLAETSYHQILYWPWCHQQKFLGSWWFSFVHSHPLKVPLGFPYQNNIRHKDNQWNLLFIELVLGYGSYIGKGFVVFFSFCLIVCGYFFVVHVFVTFVRSWSHWKANIITMKTVTYSLQNYRLSVRKV